VPLPEEVDADRAKASFKDGVLEVVLPKKAEAKPKEKKLKVE
jgi:HSP20 family protein